MIPFKKINDIKRGSWHSGRWSWGQPIVKILWDHQGMTLCSCFMLSNKETESLKIMANLRELIP
jgi:hypothetical protein